MKKSILFFTIILTSLLSIPVFSQIDNEPEALGLPGDNLNLYAVLDVFQKSKTLEEFENAINNKERNINNLDLNNDNLTDFIEVVSHKQGNSYSIVLRTAINNTEYQDIAVIEVIKTSSDKVFVQIIGDEDLYGKDYIVEPSGTIYNSKNPNPGYAGEDYSRGNIGRSTVIYVSDWPVIIDLFSPTFRLYISPWHWGFYPSYWYPWAPVYFYNYWGYHNHYYRNHYFRRGGYIRYPNHYLYYSNRRNSSVIVREHNRTGNYRGTYDGRTFKKSDAPVRTINPSSRQRTQPANRQRSDVPMRQSQPRSGQENRAPMNRKVGTQTRQSGTEPTRQRQPQASPERGSKQQTQSVNRQSVPQSRPSARQTPRSNNNQPRQ